MLQVKCLLCTESQCKVHLNCVNAAIISIFILRIAFIMQVFAQTCLYHPTELNTKVAFYCIF